MDKVFIVRGQALREGRETREAVREYLAGLSDAELQAITTQFESRKTKQPKKRENKINLIAARACQGDAFLTR